METNQLASMPMRPPRGKDHPDFRWEETTSTGLGWELEQKHWMGKTAGPHTFGKTGFTGARIVADREKGKAMVLLGNRIYPKRPPTAAAFNAVSAALCDVLFI